MCFLDLEIDHSTTINKQLDMIFQLNGHKGVWFYEA